MLDESQGLLQEGNLSRYSGPPLCVCVPSVRHWGGASPWDGLLYRPSVTHPHPIQSPRPCHASPCPHTHFPVSFCVSPVVFSPTCFLAPHWPSSAHLLCYPNQATPAPVSNMKRKKKEAKEAPTWGVRELCSSCSLWVFPVDVPSPKVSLFSHWYDAVLGPKLRLSHTQLWLCPWIYNISMP